MNSFIKTKLRILLEGVKSTYSPNNPSSRKLNINVDYSNLRDFDNELNNSKNRIIELLATHVSKFKPNDKRVESDKGKKYFNDATEGDGVYLAIISKTGKIKITTPNRKFNDNEIGGIFTSGIYNNLMVPIRAYSGNDEYIRTGMGNVTGKPYGDSGADDARLKVYNIFGDTIKNMVKSNAEKEDKYVEKDGSFTGNTEKQINRKEFINQREKEREIRQKSKQPLGLSPDEEDAVTKRQAELQAKYDKIKQKRGY